MEDNQDPLAPPPSGLNFSNVLTPLMLIVRVVGVLVMIFGIWSGIKVVSEAWEIYHNPEKIGKFSVKIEEQAGINKFVQSFRKGGTVPNVSYFASWVVVVLLLLIIARIAIWAIAEGGKLALYNADSERIAKAMVKEIISEMQKK